jgi:UDP-N-acetyl-D-glucosamine dehydrogenase
MDQLLAKLQDESWTAGIIGLGYVGLPLAMTASSAGLQVVGYDVSPELVDGLNQGRSQIEDVAEDDLRHALTNGANFTTSVEDLRSADAIFIAVPSPLGRNRQPDLSYIESAANAVASIARPGQLVSLESTTYPGTTEELLVAALDAAGLRLDEDIFVAFSPERVDPGNMLGTADIPKVVGGVTEASGKVAVAAYGRLVKKVHLVSSARAAELTKLLENTYRSVNIALVNELAQIAHVFDIDIWEVIDAAATKPFGYQPFHPGPGVGGHCIPLDPQFLAWRAREMRVATRFIDLAEDVNLQMPNYVVERVADVLNKLQRPISSTRILAVGVAYKRNVSDDRESPAIDVLNRLAHLGANVGVLDAHVPPERLALLGHEVVDAGTLAGDWTMAVVLTDHDDVDYAGISNEVEVVLDTRGVFRRLRLDCSNVVAL